MSCNVKCILLLVLNIYPCVFLVILLIMKEGPKYVTYKFIENGMKRVPLALERMAYFQCIGHFTDGCGTSVFGR